MIKQYLELRNECDAVSERLSRLHQRHIVCRRGCSGCCVNLTVFPVEFYAIVDELSRRGESLSFDDSAECGFLDGGLCAMYAARPIICRTHGLPIVFLDDSQESSHNCVSFCELNFTGIDDDFEFDQFNTLNIDDINERLFAINMQFINDNPKLGFEPASRIPLARVCEFLN